MKNIVIATDGSPGGRDAVLFGIDLASEQGAKVTLLQVIPTTDWAHVGRGAPVRPLPDAILLRRPAALDEAEQLAADRGVMATSEVVAGIPAYEIVAYADSIGADLIVIGSRSRGTVARTLLGGVARSVLHEARRPVLVVRSAPEQVEVAAAAG